AVLRPRALVPVLGALAVALGPVTGCCIPWQRLRPDPPAGLRLRVLTCNLHYRPPDREPLERLFAEADPDVAVFQEWPRSRRELVPGGAGGAAPPAAEPAPGRRLPTPQGTRGRPDSRDPTRAA